MKKIIIIAVLFTGCKFSATTGDSATTKTEIISKIVVDTTVKHMPSYCKPEMYKITIVNGHYYPTLPHGTYLDKCESAEEAQRVINENAQICYDTWIESDKTTF